MPNGVGHFERVGICPHCRSTNIRIRRRVHLCMRWRCRRCNKVFRTPKIGEIVVKGGTRDFMLEESIPRRERRARRKVRRILAVIGALVIVGIAVGVGIGEYGLPTVTLTSDSSIQEGSDLTGVDSETTGREIDTGRGDSSLTPVATPSSLATLVPTQSQRSNSISTSTSLLAPTPTLIPVPTSTPIANPSQRHLDEKLYMLELINNERLKAGREPVALGNNVAAQLHAEAALTGCYASHWGADGLKPYMRYSLAGGYQSNGENGSGWDYCIKSSDGYAAIYSIEAEIRDAVEGWMDSSGHRRNILDPWHRKVNIGIAWDRYNAPMFAHFEGDYVNYDQLPSIESGILSIDGRTKNGATQQDLWDLAVTVYYDSPPNTLTRGQLSRTYCYDNGLKVAGLRPPAGGGSYSRHSYNSTYHPCPDPNKVSASSAPPRSVSDANRFWREAYQASNAIPIQNITVPWVTAQSWEVNGDDFRIRADISDVLAKNGEGVYSLLIWGIVGSEDVELSQYSIFWNVTPPGTYSGQ